MQIVTLRLDLAAGQGVPPRTGVLTGLFRDGQRDTVLLSEDQVQRVAMTVTMAARQGVMPTYEQLEGAEGYSRAQEFLGRREGLGHADLENWRGYVASDARPFFHGGGVVFPAARASGKLFLAVFDPFSAHGFVHAASACFDE